MSYTTEPWYHCMPTHYVNLECNFKKTNRNEVPINEERVNFNFSNYELLKGVLMRVNNRYTPEEHAYLTEKLGHSPTLLNQHGKGDKVATAKLIKRYIKDYRENPQTAPLELDMDQYEELTTLCEEALNTPVKPEGKEHVAQDVNYTQPGNISEQGDGMIYVQLRDELILPMIAGGCKYKGALQPMACLLDTGSTVSLASYSYIQSLGFSKEDLENRTKYCIKTASGVQPALGTVVVDLFLQAESKEFYKFKVELLVADCELTKLILGYNFLKACHFKWMANEEPERVVLTCFSRGEKEVRRTFTLRRDNQPVTFTNRETLNVYSMESKEVTLTAEGFCPLANGHMDIRTPHAYLPTHRGSEIRPNELKYKVSGNTDANGVWWPTTARTVLTTTFLFKEKKSYPKDMVQVFAIGVDPETLEELNSIDVGSQLTDEMDKVIYDQISLTPSYLGDNQYYEEVSPPKQEEENMYFLPKVDHLDQEWQDKFTDLFTEYKDSMSKGKTDVGEARVEPIKFPVPKEAFRDNVRTHSDTELEVIEEAVEILLKAGTIEETDGTSPWNSNIFLVSSGNESQKKLSGTIADRVSRQEQLEALRKSSRVVIDFRGVNQAVPNLFPNSVVLPKVEQILPLFHDRFVSKADIRAGYHSVALHPDVRPVTSFRLQNGKCYQYKKLPMGMHMSPQIFINVLNVVLSKRTFEQFKKDHVELKDVQFETSYLRYMDDIAIVSVQDMRVHYLLWQYLLERFQKFNMRLNVSKCQLLENDRIEYLGILIDSTNNLYSLVPDRAQAFIEHQFPLTRASLISRVMLYNYFRNLILFMKNITTCLMLLCHEHGEYNPLPLHVREFQMLKLMIKMGVRLTLPNLTLPLCLSSDASHTNYCSLLTQWIRPSQTSANFYARREGDTSIPSKTNCQHPGPKCDTFPCQQVAERTAQKLFESQQSGVDFGFPFSQEKVSKEVIKAHAPPHHDFEEDAPQLVTCGIFSKSFQKEHLLASIVYKEAHGIISAIKHFENWLRSSVVINFVISDVSWIQYLTRMKSTSTKLYGMSVYLSSFPNLYFVWTSSRVLNHACDLVSKMDTGFFLDSDFGIPREILEPTRTLNNEQMEIITPQALHKVIMSPAPKEYTDTPFRRQVKYKELPTLQELEKILKQPTPEEQVFNLMWYGSRVITPDHYIFLQKKSNKKLIPKGEISKMESKLKLDEIRTVLTKIEQHSHHVEAFSDVERLTRDFTKQLYDYMQERNMKMAEPTLYKLAERYLHSTTNRAQDFRQLVQNFYESSMVNTSVKFSRTFQEFISITQSTNSEVNITEYEDKLGVKPNVDTMIPAEDVVVLNINITVSSQHVVDINFHLPEKVIVHLATRYLGPKTTYTKLYLANESNDVIFLPSHRTLGTFKVNLNDECCKNISKIVYVIDNKQFSAEEDEPKFVLTGVFNTLFHPLYRKRYEDIGVPVLVNQLESDSQRQPELEQEQEKQLINRFLLLSHLMHNSNMISEEFVAELQNTDPDIIKIKKLVNDGKAADYKYKGKLLVLQEGEKNVVLLLDRVTLSTMLDNLHCNGYHLPTETVLNHMRKHFYHPGLKKLVLASLESCATCQFTTQSRRKKFVNQPPEDSGLLVNQVWSIDLIENLPLDKSRWKFVLLITDHVSTFCFGYPLRSKKSDEVIGALTKAFAAMNQPQVIRSDFSTTFSSEAFQEFLQEYHVEHAHAVPQRHCSVGKIERMNRAWRDLLTSVVLQGGMDARRDWGRSVYKTNSIFNNTIPFTKVNNLSRYNLFFSSLRYQPPHMISAWPTEDAEQLSSAQQEAVQRINEIRKNQRGLYKTQENPFQEGSLVSVVKSKDEQSSQDFGTGILPTSSSIYRVEEAGPSGCRLLSLKNSDQQTVDMSKLKRLSPRELMPNLASLPLTSNVFSRQIFRAGSGRTLLETLLEESNKAGKSPEEYVADGADIADPEAQEELQSANGGSTPEATEAAPDRVRDEQDSPRYRLRSRDVFHGHTARRRTVRFCKEVTLAYYFPEHETHCSYPFIVGERSRKVPLNLVQAEYLAAVFMTSVPRLDASRPEQIYHQLCQLSRQAK